VLFFNTFPKNRHLLDGHDMDEDIRTMIWFTNGYYNLMERPDGRLQFNHLRYGLTTARYEEPSDFVWYWIIEKRADSTWTGVTVPEERTFGKDDLRRFRERLLGDPDPD
jgi:hypothetical protein